MKFNSRYIKLLGLSLDIIGAILIGLSIVHINQNMQDIHSTEGIKTEIKKDSDITIVGLFLIALGFALMFGEEIYKEFVTKSKKRRKRV